MDQIEEVLKQEYLERNNSKIKGETLDDYFSTYKRSQLMQCALIPFLIEHSEQDIYNAHLVAKKTKKDVIEYVKENLEHIVNSYLKIFSQPEIKQLNKILKENKTYKVYEMPFTLSFINNIKMICMAKMEYNKPNNTITTYIPEEIKTIMLKGLKDKKLMKTNQRYHEIYSTCIEIIDTYGIIELSALHQIFEKEVYKIDIEELQNIITSKSLLDDFSIHKVNDKYIICNVDFIELKTALDFYRKQTGEYKIFTKKEYHQIYEGKFIETLKPYKELVKYLCDNYEGIEEEMEYIKEFIILDYMFTSQISPNKADEDFINKITDILETDKKENEKIKTMMHNIFAEYPKWLKRGNI